MSSDPNNPNFDPNFERRMALRANSRIDPSKEKLNLIRGEARHTRLDFPDRLLLRHALFLGATGSGKTSHVLYAIRDSIARRPKSCFIIDVKSDYRRLQGAVTEDVQVMTFPEGLECNLLVPPPGVRVERWDRAFTNIFTRAYGLSEPSRRILLDCFTMLREGAKGNPTLRELEGAVGEFKAGSTKEQASQRSLESRLHIINTGEFGRSLNSEERLDFGAMEDKVTVLEVGEIDSLRDQRFLAETMLAQLWHHDKVPKATEEDEEKLERLIVVEEAHRYLSEERPPQQRGERTLLELSIAEARACGWGFIIVDQMPLLLSRYVWDNCGTVIAHRLTNLDSYEVVKSALGGDPFIDGRDAKGDPLALRLPENLAMFRRYVEPDVNAAGTGFVMVPRVGQIEKKVS